MEEDKNENKIIENIVISYDWEEVLNYIVFSENINPMDIDLIKLTNAFMEYLKRLKDFDFRIPGRFILIAAILLRMKMELLIEKEENEVSKKVEEAPKINIDNIKPLTPPISRKPTKSISLHELITSLQKTITFKEKKYEKKFLMKRRVERLINEEHENIELRMKRIMKKIISMGGSGIKFSSLVDPWTKKEIIRNFLPILYLSSSGKVTCDQKELFDEIYISII